MYQRTRGETPGSEAVVIKTQRAHQKVWQSLSSKGALSLSILFAKYSYQDDEKWSQRWKRLRKREVNSLESVRGCGGRECLAYGFWMRWERGRVTAAVTVGHTGCGAQLCCPLLIPADPMSVPRASPHGRACVGGQGRAGHPPCLLQLGFC